MFIICPIYSYPVIELQDYFDNERNKSFSQSPKASIHLHGPSAPPKDRSFNTHLATLVLVTFQGPVCVLGTPTSPSPPPGYGTPC